MSEETQVTPDQTTEAPQVDEAPVVEEAKVHPAYEKVLAELPEAWHSKITPHLQEQDKYFQQQLEKYTPFKDLVDEGISAEVIKGGLSLAQAIDSDPVAVYTNLQKYLKDQGLLAEEAKQAAQEIMEEKSGDDFENIFDEGDVPPALKKELDALKAKTDEVENWKNQQELDRATEGEIEKLQADMETLRSQHNISDAHETAIYRLMEASLNAGVTITVAEAAKQLSEMIGGLSPAQAGETAPTVVGSSGGAGVPAPDLSVPKDAAGKKAMMAQMFEQYKNSNR